VRNSDRATQRKCKWPKITGLKLFTVHVLPFARNTLVGSLYAK
jgi:hypothetical protein